MDGFLPQGTVLVAGAGVGADADKNIYGVGACTGAHKKKRVRVREGGEVVGQSEKNAGAGSGCVPAEVEDKLMVGAGTVVLVAGHQTR